MYQYIQKLEKQTRVLILMPVGLFLDVTQAEFIPRPNQIHVGRETAQFHIQ